MHKVLVGPVEVAGIGAGLVQGFRSLGIRAELVLSVPHPFGYQSQGVSWIFRCWSALGAFRQRTPARRLFLKLGSVLVHWAWTWLVLFVALIRFNAFVFIYGRTITDTAFELWLIKRLGKRIVFVYVGSDSRPPYMDGGRFPGTAKDELPEADVLLSVSRRSKADILRHERHADYLVNSPTTAQFHERAYINWFCIGIPKALAVAALQSEGVRRHPDKVRILHSPSSPLVKGTAEILRVIEDLQTKGYGIELVKIEGMPNNRVLQELAACDFVVDQLYADTPLATFATEAAWFGKPAVVGGYCGDVLRQSLRLSDMPPSLLVMPDMLAAAIERMVTDPTYREALGERARRFVETNWNATEVARRYLRLLDGDVPSEWWCDPADSHYVYGCGLPLERSRQLLELLLRAHGPDSLQVNDKPVLRQALIGFAAGDEEATHA